MHTLGCQESIRIMSYRLTCVQADDMRAILFCRSTGAHNDTLSSIVSKSVTKSQLWIFSKMNPKLRKNKIMILNVISLSHIYNLPEPLCGTRRVTMTPKERCAGIFHAVDWRILPPLLSHFCRGRDSGAAGLYTCTQVLNHIVSLMSCVKVLCFASQNVTVRKHSPSSSGGSLRA